MSYQAGPEHKAEESLVLLITCSDLRLREAVCSYAKAATLTDIYDEIVLPGASLGTINPKDKSWQKAFSSQMQLLVELHKLSKVIFLDHEDCGCYKHVFGDKLYKKYATELHKKCLAKAGKRIKEVYPDIKIETNIMSLNGTVSSL